MNAPQRIVVAALLALATAPSARGSAAAAGRFELIVAERGDSLERKLNTVEEAMRVLATAHTPTIGGKGRFLALLERADQRYEHAVLSLSGDFDEPVLAALNARAAEGFRLRPSGVVASRLGDWWLPEQAYEDQVLLVLERPTVGATARYAYASVVVKGYDPLYEALKERREQGYAVVGFVNTARRLRVLLERRLGAAPRPPPAGPEEPYRLLMRAKKRSLRKRLRIAGAEGYRVVFAVDQSINAPPMVLLEYTGGPTPEFEYALIHEPLERLRRGKLERKLNRKTAEGFRVAVDGITARVMALEPVARGVAPPRYRTVTVVSPLGLPDALETAAASGYGFVTLFAEATRTTVVLERPGNASPADALAATAGEPRPGA